MTTAVFLLDFAVGLARSCKFQIAIRNCVALRSPRILAAFFVAFFGFCHGCVLSVECWVSVVWVLFVTENKRVIKLQKIITPFLFWTAAFGSRHCTVGTTTVRVLRGVHKKKQLLCLDCALQTASTWRLRSFTLHTSPCRDELGGRLKGKAAVINKPRQWRVVERIHEWQWRLWWRAISFQ